MLIRVSHTAPILPNAPSQPMAPQVHMPSQSVDFQTGSTLSLLRLSFCTARRHWKANTSVKMSRRKNLKNFSCHKHPTIGRAVGPGGNCLFFHSSFTSWTTKKQRKSSMKMELNASIVSEVEPAWVPRHTAPYGGRGNRTYSPINFIPCRCDTIYTYCPLEKAVFQSHTCCLRHCLGRSMSNNRMK